MCLPTAVHARAASRARAVTSRVARLDESGRTRPARAEPAQATHSCFESSRAWTSFTKPCGHETFKGSLFSHTSRHSRLERPVADHSPLACMQTPRTPRPHECQISARIAPQAATRFLMEGSIVWRPLAARPTRIAAAGGSSQGGRSVIPQSGARGEK
jgi:hypothetical protein